MRAIDTNVLVRLITHDEPSQTGRAEEFTQAGAWVSLLVLAEATWVLDSAYQRRPAQIADAVAVLLQHQQLSVQDPDVAAAALARFRERPALGFSDCLVLEIARKAGHLPLGTFDRGLSKLPGAESL